MIWQTMLYGIVAVNMAGTVVLLALLALETGDEKGEK